MMPSRFLMAKEQKQRIGENLTQLAATMIKK